MILRQWAVVITVSIGAMLEVIDVSICNVALPHIQANLGATLAEVGWVVTGYAMASVVMIPLSEWLSERFGQRSYFVFCLAGFTGASVLCGLAPNLPALVLARIAQGLLGGGLLPKAQAILFQAVPRQWQGMAQGLFGVVVLAGPAIGPTLGGFLTDGPGWRWIFFINLPFGILTVLMALAFLPPDRDRTWGDEQGRPLRPEGQQRRVDWTGIALLAAGLGSLQVVLEQGHQYDWLDNGGIRLLTLLAAAALPAFVWWELRCRAPAVDLRVLRHRSLAAGSLFSLVLGMGLYGTVFVVPIFAQTVLQYTATQTGLLMLPGALASALTMAVLGRNARRFDPRHLIVLGAVAMVVTMLQLAALGPDTGEHSLFWPLIFRGVTTVVAKLFNLILPDISIFGAKDWQQAAVLRRMAADLNFHGRIVVSPTIRERDGLAMSSRNAYLTPAQRKQAICLWNAIREARRIIRSRGRSVPCSSLVRTLSRGIELNPEAKIDYLAFFDPETLVPATRVGVGTHFALAVRVGTTRLIDNARI